MEKALEKEYGDREKYLPRVNDIIKSSRDILLGVLRDNPKVLGDFGFTVDDTPRPPKVKVPPSVTSAKEEPKK